MVNLLSFYLNFARFLTGTKNDWKVTFAESNQSDCFHKTISTNSKGWHIHLRTLVCRTTWTGSGQARIPLTLPINQAGVNPK